MVRSYTYGMDKNKSPNWDEIRIEYLNTDLQIRAIARKHGVPESTVRKRRDKEGWDETKERMLKAKAEAAISAAIKAQGSIAKTATDTLDILVKKLNIAAVAAEAYDVRTLKDITAAMATIKDMGLYRVEGTDSAIEVKLGEEGSSYAD